MTLPDSATLSLEQKIALLSGADFWRTSAIPDANIPQIKLTDGPNGARGDLAKSVPAACFPVGVALGATWNTELLGEIGSALADETKTKAAHVLLGPTINLQRTPLGGRNFECYSEDPCLTAELAVSYVNALQEKNIGACPKHFVGNDTEFERMTISSNIDPRTLREVYLVPFESVVKNSNPWSIMCSYNRINGTYASSHRALLTDILKDEWGFDGVIVSDWFAARDGVNDAKGGLDLEMPGPTRVWGAQLVSAVNDGAVDQAEVDDKANRMLHLISRTGVQPTDAARKETGVDDPVHRELIRRAAAESMVLLKNETGRLPLDKEQARSLAVIGPNAETGQIMGGGSSFVNSHPPVHPLEGIQAAFPRANVRHEPGCTNHKYVPVLKPGTYFAPDGTVNRLLKETFENDGFEGEPARQELIGSSAMTMLENTNISDGISRDSSIRISGTYRPDRDGSHDVGMFSAGPARLWIDGKMIIDNWTDWAPGESFFGFGSAEKRAVHQFAKGKNCKIVVEYFRPGAALISGVQFGIFPSYSTDMIDRAAIAATDCENAVLIIGSNSDWESEGHDRENMELSGEQNALVEAVLDANPETIIVLNIGSPVTMPWYDRAKTVLVCWFPGEEMGNALADVISGSAEPSGRLPFTWPKQLQDHPAYHCYPGVGGQMPYEEGLLVGHRWYDKNSIEPLAPFGAGLGYGSIDIVEMTGSQDQVVVTAENRADRDSKAAIQIYAEDRAALNDEPKRILVGFAKQEIRAGEKRLITVKICSEMLRSWSSEKNAWEISKDYHLCAAQSAAGPFCGLADSSTLRPD